jgi:hypothetical protein
MRKLIVPIIALSIPLANCGGDSESGGTDPKIDYPYVAPVAKSQRVYQETIVDNLNSTIDISFTDTISSVASDGSYVVVQQNTSPDPTMIDGVNWVVPNETIQENNIGQDVGYSFVNSEGKTITCTETPHGPGPEQPLTVGMSWSLTYAINCSGGFNVSYQQNAVIAGVESVTVPAGTFNALKIESVFTWTDPDGATRTEILTNWRDTATSISVKQAAMDFFPASASTAYGVSRNIELTSD